MACSVRMMGPGIRSSRAPARIRRLRFAIRFLGCMGGSISGRIRGFGRRRMGIALLGIGGWSRFSYLEEARRVLNGSCLGSADSRHRFMAQPPPSQQLQNH